MGGYELWIWVSMAIFVSSFVKTLNVSAYSWALLAHSTLVIAITRPYVSKSHLAEHHLLCGKAADGLTYCVFPHKRQTNTTFGSNLQLIIKALSWLKCARAGKSLSLEFPLVLTGHFVLQLIKPVTAHSLSPGSVFFVWRD